MAVPGVDQRFGLVRQPKVALAWLVGLQMLAYLSLWALLHLPAVIPPVDNGWFTAGSAYLTLVARMPLYGALANHARTGGLLLLIHFGVLTLLYGLSIWVVRAGRIHLSGRVLAASTACLAAPLLFAPHLFSSDVYSYALFGRIALLYGGNPFIDAPARFATDPLLQHVAWKTTASVYGPVWIGVSLGITAVAQLLGGSAGVYVLLYKLVAFVSYILSVVVVGRVLQRHWPRRATWGSLLYAWHPLVVIEFAASGHNDSLMVLLIVLALWLAPERPLLTVGCLVLAGLIKPVALALVPLYLLYTWHDSPAQTVWLLAKQLGVAVALLVALYAPFWNGPATLAILRTAPPLTLLHDSPADWMATKLVARRCSASPRGSRAELSTPAVDTRTRCRETTQTAVRLTSLILFGLAFITLLVRPIHSFDELIERASLFFVAYILLAAVHFEPWYVTWLLVLAPLLPRPAPLVLVWGCSTLLLYSSLPLPARLELAFAPILVELLWQLVVRLSGPMRTNASALRLRARR